MRLLALCIMVVLCSGCRLGPSAIQQGRNAFYEGDLHSARSHLVRSIKRERPHKDVAKLELAVLELADGNPEAADALLRDCRQLFDEREGVANAFDLRSILTDDRDRLYHTAGYEDVMIRSLLAISSLISGSGDAEAYAIQAQMRQSELVQQAESRGLENIGDAFQPLALSPYVRGIVRESNLHDYDDAKRAYELVAQWHPSFRPIQDDIRRVTYQTHSKPGHGVVYIFAFVGKGPVRVEERAEATGTALLIADRIASAASNLTIPPTLAPIPVPAVHVPFASIQTIAVSVNDQSVGVTQPITDVGQLATRQVTAELPWTIARGVVRRTAKKALVTGAIESVAKDNQWLELGGALAGSLWEAAERADTRCWSLLPREIQVLRVELPAGKHSVALSGVGPQTIPHQATATVEVRNGTNSFLLAVAPDRQIQSVIVGR